MTTPEQMSNPDLIISIAETSSFGDGGGRGGGRGGRGGFRGRGGGRGGGGGGDDIRRGPYTRDNKEETKQKAPRPAAEPKSEGMTEAGSSTQPSPMAVDTDHSAASAVATAVLAASSNSGILLSLPPAPLTRLSLKVTDEDYLLGIADLTGELMRLAINTLGQSIIAVPQDPSTATAALPTPEVRVQQILNFLRDIKSGFDGLSLTRASPISKKMGVLKQSLNKIELACYNVKVRGAEYPPEILRQLLMSGQDIGGGGGQNGSDAGNEDDE